MHQFVGIELTISLETSTRKYTITKEKRYRGKYERHFLLTYTSKNIGTRKKKESIIYGL